MVPSPRHVLVVDDDPAICTLMQALFNHSGYVCQTVRTGAEAVMRLAEREYDALLVDERLLRPLFRGLNGNAPHVAARTIVLGAGIFPPIAHTRALLSKPLDLEMLMAVVKTVAEGNGDRAE